MKKIFIILCTVLFAHCSYCQIQNAGFEEWEERDGRILPVNWSYSYYMGVSPNKEVTIKNGNSALILYTLIDGIVATSRISHIANGLCDALRGRNCGNPINFRPKFLSGYYNLYSVWKAEPQGLAKDTAMIRVILKKYNISKKSADTLVNQFIPLYDTPNQKILTQFKQELLYNQNLKNMVPDTVVIIIATNQRFFSRKFSYQNLMKYNELIIDDLNLSDEPSSIESLTNNSSLLTLYPNPTNAQLQIKNSATFTKFAVYNSAGQKLLETLASENLDVSSLPEGLYLLELSDNEGKREVQKFIKGGH